MEQIAILIVVLLVFAFIAFPIWVIVRFANLSRELRETREEIAALRKSGGKVDVPPKVEAGVLTASVEQSELDAGVKTEKAKAVETPASTVNPVLPPPLIVPPVMPGQSMPPPILQDVKKENAPPVEPPQSSAQQQQQPPPSPQEPAHSFNWEVFLGTKFLSWLGAVVAFLAVAFFLKFSIEHGLIPPVVRAAMGFIFGAGLIVGGLFAVRKNYAITGHALCACGVVSLYGVTFACRALYHFPFFGVVPTFALMSLITVAAFTLAVRLNGKFIAILGMLGGFATPILLSTGVDNPLGLFGYIALLVVGLYAVALHRGWNFLVPLGALGTACMEIGWAFKFLGNHNLYVAMIVCLAFDVLFLAGYCVARRLRREGVMHARSVAALVLVSFGFALYLGVDTAAAWIPQWLLVFVFLADACALAVAALDRRAKDSGWLPAVAGLAVFVVLGAWSVASVDAQSHLLPWALGAYFIFAVAHTAFPLVLARMRPEIGRAAGGAVAQFFAPLALLLIILPLLKDPDTPWLVWPAILLIDFVAIVCAAMSRSIIGVAASLVLTLASAAVWVCKIPVTATFVPLSLLLVVGGFAVLFFAASLWLGRRRAGTDGGNGFGMAALPALSSLLPFVLIVMMEARITLADPTPVFGLGLLLTVLTLGLSKILKNEWLPACALAGVLAICYVWRGSVRWMAFDPAQQIAAATALGWFVGFYAIFTVFPFVFRSCFSNTRGAWVSSAASGVLFFPLIYWMVKVYWPNDVMGLVPAVFAVPALLCLVVILRLDSPENPRRMGRLALFGGVALLFITLIFPIHFSREWVTIAWALEGTALLWLYTRVPHRALPWAGAGLLAVAFVRLACNTAVLSYHVRGDTPILNWYLYTYGIAIVCMFVGAWFLRLAKSQNRFTAIVEKILPAFGAVLAFLLLNIEIADFFTEPGSRALTLEFSGNFARDMSYTIAWALFALVLLVAGIARGQRVPRYAALGLLAVVALKLAFHDLDSLDTLYRVGALFGAAVVMILASMLYQKYITPRDSGTGKTPPSVPPPPPATPPPFAQ